MEPIGFSVTEDILDDLEDLQAEWDARESRSISRSEVAREAMEVGLVALLVLDDENPAMSTRQRKAVVRQATLDHFREDE